MFNIITKMNSPDLHFQIQRNIPVLSGTPLYFQPGPIHKLPTESKIQKYGTLLIARKDILTKKYIFIMFSE